MMKKYEQNHTRNKGVGGMMKRNAKTVVGKLGTSYKNEHYSGDKWPNLPLIRSKKNNRSNKKSDLRRHKNSYQSMQKMLKVEIKQDSQPWLNQKPNKNGGVNNRKDYVFPLQARYSVKGGKGMRTPFQKTRRHWQGKKGQQRH